MISVDLGSGKAYLSQVLSTLYSIPVYAVDSKATNTAGAANRAKNLGRKWTSLQIRAKERAEGAAAPRSRKQRIRQGLQPPAELSAARRGPLTLVTQHIEENSDLGHIVLAAEASGEQQEGEGAGPSLGVMGLHTCGNLAAASIKLFFATPSAKFICNVGCCYHLLEEEFYVNPFLELDTEDRGTPGETTIG
jgi:hypothetical protein